MDKTERIARKLLPAAALTAALPMVPAIYAPFVPGWSEPQPMHQPDKRGAAPSGPRLRPGDGRHNSVGIVYRQWHGVGVVYRQLFGVAKAVERVARPMTPPNRFQPPLGALERPWPVSLCLLPRYFGRPLLRAAGRKCPARALGARAGQGYWR